MPKFHVVLLQCGDEDPPRLLTPREVLLHARAEHYRRRYRTTLGIAAGQVVMTTLMAALGVSASAILIGMLGGTLAIAASCCWAAWVTRKDLIE